MKNLLNRIKLKFSEVFSKKVKDKNKVITAQHDMLKELNIEVNMLRAEADKIKDENSRLAEKLRTNEIELKKIYNKVRTQNEADTLLTVMQLKQKIITGKLNNQVDQFEVERLSENLSRLQNERGILMQRHKAFMEAQTDMGALSRYGSAMGSLLG